jgi:hypothetical protein
MGNWMDKRASSEAQLCVGRDSTSATRFTTQIYGAGFYNMKESYDQNLCSE